MWSAIGVGVSTGGEGLRGLATGGRAEMGLRPLASRGGRQSNDMTPPPHGTPCVGAAYYEALKGRCRVAQGHRVAQSGRFEES